MTKRFSRKSDKRYKRIRKIVLNLKVPPSHLYIPGRTYGVRWPYIEVIRLVESDGRTVCDSLGKVYFDGRPNKVDVSYELEQLLA